MAMTPGPARLAVRLLAAACGAAIALLLWDLWLRDREAEARAREDESRRAVASMGPDVAALLPADRMLDVGAVVLCDAPGAVPEAAAEWRLLADGRVVARRAAPLPSAPGRTPVTAVSVVLPVLSLAALTPEARASLIDLLSSLWRDRPVAADRLLLQGIEGDRGDREALLAWLR